MSMTKFVARRSVEIVITLFIIATLTFALFRLMPSDPVGLMVHPLWTPEMKQKQRELCPPQFCCFRVLLYYPFLWVCI